MFSIDVLKVANISIASFGEYVKLTQNSRDKNFKRFFTIDRLFQINCFGNNEEHSCLRIHNSKMLGFREKKSILIIHKNIFLMSFYPTKQKMIKYICIDYGKDHL